MMIRTRGSEDPPLASAVMATQTVLGTCHHDYPDSCGWVATVEEGNRK